MKVLVIGCAKSGLWVSKLLNREGYEVTITDKKEIKEKEELEALGVKVYDNGHPEFLMNTEWDFVVKNPGIPYSNPFVHYFTEKNVPLYTEIEIAIRYAKNFSYGAITGTNGKTTTTTMLYEILKKKYLAFASGNIGTALSDTVYHYGDKEAKISLEISALQLVGCPSFHPVASVIMNLTPDHLDFFDTLDDYYNAKCLVYRNQTEDDWFLKNLDDKEVMARCTNVPCRVVTFSLYQKADLMVDGEWVTLFGEKMFRKDDLKVVGMHNVQNAMVAAAMAYKMGVDQATIRETLQNFEAIEHRIEYVKTVKGVKYYNDSKGTNVDSTVMALRAFDQPVILLAGGHDKKTGFADLYNYTDKMKYLITFGETKEELSHLKKDSIIVENMKEALEKAYELAKEGDIVLLSPACSSYDQFKNFEERGRIFKDYVRQLKD